MAGLGANFLVASMGQGNAWFVGLKRLRHEPGWIDPWHKYFNTHANEGRLLVDVRSPQEFALWHIPGALNVPAASTTEPQTGRFRSPDDLRALLRQAGVNSRRRLILYDSVGLGACKLAFALTLMGYDDVAVYDGPLVLQRLDAERRPPAYAERRPPAGPGSAIPDRATGSLPAITTRPSHRRNPSCGGAGR